LLAAVADDPGHRREGLGVVDRGGLAVEPVARRERRLEARLALLALERLEQRGFLAADVGAVAMERVQLEGELRAEDALAEPARRASFIYRRFEKGVGIPDLAVDVVVADADAHRVSRDRHAFDDDVRVVAQDVAILERARLAFVGIADQALLARDLA